MTPINFPECNCTFGPPGELTEEQVRTIPAFRGKFEGDGSPSIFFQGAYEGGSCDGAPCVVVAYQLTPEDFEALKQNGGVIYFSMMGGLAPHYPSLNFHDATHPA